MRDSIGRTPSPPARPDNQQVSAEGRRSIQGNRKSSGDGINFLNGIGAVITLSARGLKKPFQEDVKTHWHTSSSKLATLLRAGEDPICSGPSEGLHH